MKQPVYKRILLKMSGAVLAGKGDSAIDADIVDRLVKEIKAIHSLGVQIGIVIGGGNFFRGAMLANNGLDRVTGDHMGMLATIINALALRDAFEKTDIAVRVLSAIPMSGIVGHFDRRKAMHHLRQGRVVIFAAGTGNPLVTTDSAASLRGIEVQADAILKATNVDGIYSKDPRSNPDAKRYQTLTYKEALDRELEVMDLSAFCQCRDHDMILRVFNINAPGVLQRIILGENDGTLVNN